MKNLLLPSLLLLTLAAGAQKIGGFYSGTLYNDSTKMLQKYELALSEYRGKISGYSYVTFISNDTFYYGIRKIRAEIQGDSLIVQDDKMLVHNFPQAPAKGVGRVITIPLRGQDSLVTISGRWKTNQTKKYYSVPGAIELSRSEDSTHSPLIAHLKELNIIPSTPYQNSDAVAVAQVQKPEEKKSPERKEAEKPVRAEPQPAVVASRKERKKEMETEKPKTDLALSRENEKAEERKPAPVSPALVPAAPAKLAYTERKTKAPQVFEVQSDSLVLAFYDNGVVDGDSISVYLDGKAVVSAARLRTVATKVTVSVAGKDEVSLVLVAENLGSIPPNTGLLTIRDGEDQYQVNFSADMQTNASILIRRKKK